MSRTEIWPSGLLWTFSFNQSEKRWVQKIWKPAHEEKLCFHLDWLKVRSVGLGSNVSWSCVCRCGCSDTQRSSVSVYECVYVSCCCCCCCWGSFVEINLSHLFCHLQKAELTRASEVNSIWWEVRRERERERCVSYCLKLNEMQDITHRFVFLKQIIDLV